jgi:hypothetical protein
MIGRRWRRPTATAEAQQSGAREHSRRGRRHVSQLLERCAGLLDSAMKRSKPRDVPGEKRATSARIALASPE